MPEDSGSKYNPGDTLSEETIVSDVDEEALMEAEPEPDIETERPKANKEVGNLAVFSFPQQI